MMPIPQRRPHAGSHRAGPSPAVTCSAAVSAATASAAAAPAAARRAGELGEALGLATQRVELDAFALGRVDEHDRSLPCVPNTSAHTHRRPGSSGPSEM